MFRLSNPAQRIVAAGEERRCDEDPGERQAEGLLVGDLLGPEPGVEGAVKTIWFKVWFENVPPPEEVKV